MNDSGNIEGVICPRICPAGVWEGRHLLFLSWPISLVDGINRWGILLGKGQLTMAPSPTVRTWEIMILQVILTGECAQGPLRWEGGLGVSARGPEYRSRKPNCPSSKPFLPLPSCVTVN